MLGLIIDTNKLINSIPYTYLKEVLDLLNSTLHPNRRCFRVSKAWQLTGKLARLVEGANWVFHLLSHLYSSIAYALSESRKFLMESSHEFQDIIKNLQTGAFLIHCKDLAWHTSFAMERAAKITHHTSYWYNINKRMHRELEFSRDKLKPDSGIYWENPIVHLIPHRPFTTTIGDSSLNRAGGFLITLGFWWHITFPDKVIQFTLYFKSDNADGTLILINILEFIMVNINYCAALHVIRTTPITDDPHPVLLNITDKISALNRTIHTCKRSKIGCLLACFFCSLLINLPYLASTYIESVQRKTLLLMTFLA
jgi:hypothetical protein